MRTPLLALGAVLFGAWLPLPAVVRAAPARAVLDAIELKAAEMPAQDVQRVDLAHARWTLTAACRHRFQWEPRVRPAHRGFPCWGLLVIT